MNVWLSRAIPAAVFVVGGGGLTGCATTVEPADPPAGHAWVVVGADTLVVEVAATSEARGEGLSGRDSIPEGTGMLFLWTEVRHRSFWMDNVPFALDLTFLTDGYVVVSTEPLEPLSREFVRSPVPVTAALETPQGTMAALGVQPGDTLHVRLAPPVP